MTFSANPSYSGAGYGESRKSGFEAGGGKATSCSTVTGVGFGRELSRTGVGCGEWEL
ncbi:hypothetical protein [Microcystis aeruginosa]|uniref:Uncharacterized protein n=1 Tax=Microcystis aeruginosa (strain NIES-843 / IAM M-2473) TaxID=449447 RepID=B0JMQ7_MICAN|nr:hypothetical protein [Microcystis aeruginosa]BAG03342.1 unknown protein [Microcystis aeruginosa NIES-843]